MFSLSNFGDNKVYITYDLRMNRLLPFLLIMLWISPAFADEAFFQEQLLEANLGNAKAQYNLGVMFKRGSGVPENDVKAYSRWSVAKAQGDEDATINLDMVKKGMTKEQIVQGQALAAKCWESEFQDCD